MRRIPVREVLLSNVSEATLSSAYRVTDFRHVVLNIQGSASANLKVFIKGAIEKADKGVSSFNANSAERSVNAQWWDFIDADDLEDGASIDGDTGIDINGNVVRLVEVNVNHLDFIAVHATGVTAGTVSVVASFVTNE